MNGDIVRSYLHDLQAAGCKPCTNPLYAERIAAMPADSLPYDQGARHPILRFRLDCSGWASHLMGAYLDGPGSWGGFSTATLATYGVIYPIPLSEAIVGDYLGRCGPGTDSSGEGGGHIAPIVGRTGNTFMVYDHGGGSLGNGPNRRNAPASAAWAKQAWRYAFMDNATPPVIGTRPEVMIGMFGGDVKDIQRAVGAKEDGEFGSITHGLVTEWQRAHGLLADGIVGPKTAAEMRKLYDAEPPPEPTPVPPSDYVTKGELVAALKAQQDHMHEYVETEVREAMLRLSAIIQEAWELP